MMKRFRLPQHSLGMIAIILFLAIAVLPAAIVLAKSCFVDGTLSLKHYLSTFSDSRLLGILLRSVCLAINATILSFCFGLPFALFLARCHFWGRKVCAVTFLIPLFIPSHIHALAWIYLTGEQGVFNKILTQFFHLDSAIFHLYSFYGTVFVLFLSYFPLMVLPILAGLSTVDQRCEEVAWFVHTPMYSLFRITLPLVTPHIISGCVFVFLFSFFNYGVPSMLRVPSYPVEIFTRFSAFYDEGGAAALAAPAIIFALLLLMVQNRVLKNKRYTTINTGQISGRSSLSPLITGCISVFMFTLLFVSVFLPVSALCFQAKTFDSFRLAIQGAHGDIVTTLALGAATATLATIFSIILNRFKEQLPLNKRSVFQALIMIPFAIPATFIGIGMIYLWNNNLTDFIYSSLAIVILACLARFLPFSLRVTEDAMQQIDPGLREAAIMAQPGLLQRWWRIELPLMRKGLTVCWIITFVLTTGELGATLLVIPPGSGTLSLKIYTLMHYGAGPLVAALALILVTINLIIASGLLLPNRMEQV